MILRYLRLGLPFLVGFAFASASFAQNECPGQHCSAKAQIVNLMCVNLGQAGGVVFVEHQGSYCWCKCSCLASITPVEVAPGQWKQIGSIAKGEQVLVLTQNDKWVAAPVVFSDGTTMPEQPYPYAVYIQPKGGKQLIVTADHLFLMPDRTLKRADRLTPKDKLLSPTLKPIEIESVTPGSYHGPIHHIAATAWEAPSGIYGHLLNTNGVVSVDYYGELHFASSVQELEPQAGSTEYKVLHAPLLATSLKKEVINLGSAPNGQLIKFIPARDFVPPENAIPFLPPGKDVAKPGALAPLDVTVPYEIAQSLVNYYKRFYPSITFHIEWHDNRVNAYAWMVGNERHVALMGGLLRHWAVKQEAVALVLAHEIGHHFGGPPRYPDNPWASCEGQSDYWGALVGMRTVWWGQYALQQTQAASQQLYNLFAYGLAAGNLLLEKPAAAAGLCTHPVAQCRLDTYRAAMSLDPKPACAGDPQ